MPDAIGGRYTDPGNQGRQIAEHGKAIAQLQRLMANRPKIPAPASGGVQGVTRCTPGSVTQSNAAAPVGSALYFADWEIAELEGSIEAPEVSDAGGGYLSVGAAGLYQFNAPLRLTWDGTPLEAAVTADWAGSADPNPEWQVRLTSSDLQGGGDAMLRDSFAWGPVYLDAGAEVFLGVVWQTADTAFLSAAAVDVWLIG